MAGTPIVRMAVRIAASPMAVGTGPWQQSQGYRLSQDV